MGRIEPRQLLAFATLLTLFLLGLGCGCSQHAPAESTPTPDARETASSAGDGREPRVERSLLGTGGTLGRALVDLGLEDEVRPEVIRFLGEAVDVRRLSPATGLSVVYDEQGVAVTVSCRDKHEGFARVTLADGRPAGVERLEIPVEHAMASAGGTVQTTVAGALSGFPDSVALTHAYAEIFQWDVDLFVDPRPGDRVLLVYENLRLGDPPVDLPPFGKSGIEAGAYLGIGRILAAAYEGERVESSAYWVADDGRGGGYYDPEGDSLRKTFLKSPLNYRRISSGFSRARRHPITRKVVPHHGVDFVAPRGTPVAAAADGKVISAGWDGALGRAVRVRHGNGFVTIYGHLNGFARGIRRGSRVTQNQVIGYVGSTGRATGPHLHYTLLRHGQALNPMTFHNPPTGPLEESRIPLLREAMLTWTPALRAAAPDGSRTGVAAATATAGLPGAGL
jgi:murein DD-endopeptidase MepM/ murein hydrolase activator NlpD